jgi:hypothetical protein
VYIEDLQWADFPSQGAIRLIRFRVNFEANQATELNTYSYVKCIFNNAFISAFVIPDTLLGLKPITILNLFSGNKKKLYIISPRENPIDILPSAYLTFFHLPLSSHDCVSKRSKQKLCVHSCH